MAVLRLILALPGLMGGEWIRTTILVTNRWCGWVAGCG
jgi:hypothetical protein